MPTASEAKRFPLLRELEIRNSPEERYPRKERTRAHGRSVGTYMLGDILTSLSVIGSISYECSWGRGISVVSDIVVIVVIAPIRLARAASGHPLRVSSPPNVFAFPFPGECRCAEVRLPSFLTFPYPCQFAFFLVPFS